MGNGCPHGLVSKCTFACRSFQQLRLPAFLNCLFRCRPPPPLLQLSFPPLLRRRSLSFAHLGERLLASCLFLLQVQL